MIVAYTAACTTCTIAFTAARSTAGVDVELVLHTFTALTVLTPTCETRHPPGCRSERVYSHVFRMLNEYDVMVDAILLKPNMCLPGLYKLRLVVCAVEHVGRC